MCQPASFVVTKQSVFWSKHTESHESIIREYELHEGNPGNPNLVRVELQPKAQDKYGYPDFLSPPEEWKFETVQDLVPRWYTAEDVERRVRLMLPQWHKAKIVPPDETKLLVEDRHIVAIYGRVDGIANCHIDYLFGQVGDIDRSYIGYLGGKGKINMLYRTNIVFSMKDRAKIERAEGRIQCMEDNARIKTLGYYGIIDSMRSSHAQIKHAVHGSVIKTLSFSRTTLSQIVQHNKGAVIWTG